MTNEVSLESLVGEHILDGVDMYIEKVNTYGSEFEDASAIRFRLDGIVYTAIEDPDDGYRSSMGNLFSSASEKMVNTFTGVRVLARKKPDNEWGNVNDTVEMVDMVTGLVAIEVGTDNSDDYYPSFVSNFNPENMAINQ